MISIIKILNEVLTPYQKNSSILQRGSRQLFAHGVEPPIWNLVISDEDGGGFKDPKKRNSFLLALERHLNAKKLYYDYQYDTDQILEKLKYYPATDKFVGTLPKFLFKNKPSLKNCKISYEISKVSPTINIREKK